jgi:uncharacterized lipoprotein YmbA
MLDYLGSPEILARDVMVLIAEAEPNKWRHRMLQDQRRVFLANVRRRQSSVSVARLPYHLADD